MEKFKLGKWVPVVIAIMLVVALVGCTKKDKEDETMAPVTAAATAKATPAPTDAPAPTVAPTDAPIVTIKYANFSSSGDLEKVLGEMKDEFEKLNPKIKVEIETIAFGDYFTQMQTRVASNSAPDAYELNYENFVPYASKGVLLGIDDLMKSTNFDASTVNKQALGAFSAGGVQYGMPASFSNVLLIYNKDLFDKAGVAYPTNDWTWKEEDEAAAKIRALGKNIYGISQGVQFFEFFKSAAQNGGSLFNADKTAFTVNTPENVATLQHMTDRILKSNVMFTEKQASGVGDWDLFYDGRLGMIITGVWAFPDFTKKMKYNWDVAIEPGNVKKATHFFANGIVINKDTKVAAAAFEWVKFMSASKEAAKIRIAAGWELPAITDQATLDAYLKISPPANRQAVFDSLEFLITPPVIEQFQQMQDIMAIHLQKAAQGATTPEKALADAQKELEEKIKLK